MLENGLFIIDKFRNLNLEVHNFSMFKKMHTFATELEASRLLTHSEKTSQTERSHAWFLSHFYHSKHPIIEASDKVLVLTFIVTTAAITINNNRCYYQFYPHLLSPLNYLKECEGICGEGVGEFASVA